jgi:TRAP-type C4-dicarboxylate transport system permease small subunit
MSAETILAAASGLRRLVERLGILMSAAAGWVYVLCALFVTHDVLARTFFGYSSQATVEITGYMLAFGIAWGLAHTMTVRCHIRIDVLVNLLPVRRRAYLHALSLLLFTLFAGFLAWRSAAEVRDSWDFGALGHSPIQIPLVVPQGFWAAGIAVFAVLLVALTVEVLLLLALSRHDQVDRILGSRTLQEETEEALQAVGEKPRPSR